MITYNMISNNPDWIQEIKDQKPICLRCQNIMGLKKKFKNGNKLYNCKCGSQLKTRPGEVKLKFEYKTKIYNY